MRLIDEFLVVARVDHTTIRDVIVVFRTRGMGAGTREILARSQPDEFDSRILHRGSRGQQIVTISRPRDREPLLSLYSRGMGVREQDLQVGDVVCTRNPTGWAARLIRFGAALLDRPNIVNHVIVVHHRDPKGVLWGIEGRPGGVGDIALTRRVLSQPYVISNSLQPKTEEQRFLVAKAAERLRGAPYDWTGIMLDGLEALGVSLWDGGWGPEPPGQVVCSALADWCYDAVGLASPGRTYDRTVTPGDWCRFIMEQEWSKAL